MPPPDARRTAGRDAAAGSPAGPAREADGGTPAFARQVPGCSPAHRHEGLPLGDELDLAPAEGVLAQPHPMSGHRTPIRVLDGYLAGVQEGHLDVEEIRPVVDRVSLPQLDDRFGAVGRAVMPGELALLLLGHDRAHGGVAVGDAPQHRPAHLHLVRRGLPGAISKPFTVIAPIAHQAASPARMTLSRRGPTISR